MHLVRTVQKNECQASYSTNKREFGRIASDRHTKTLGRFQTASSHGSGLRGFCKSGGAAEVSNSSLSGAVPSNNEANLYAIVVPLLGNIIFYASISNALKLSFKASALNFTTLIKFPVHVPR